MIIKQGLKLNGNCLNLNKCNLVGLNTIKSKIMRMSFHKRVSPEEIRSTIRLMRVNNSNMNFSQFNQYGQWSNANEAMKVFNDYTDFFKIQFKIEGFQNLNIFDDIKLLLKNTQADPKTDNFFFSELLKVIKKLYVDNFLKKEFLRGESASTVLLPGNSPVHYLLRSFVFLKSILEYDYIVKNTTFMNYLFDIITRCSQIYINSMYIEDFKTFSQHTSNMDEFLSRFLSILDSKYIVAYNPIFYKFYFPKHVRTIFSNFENLVIHWLVTAQPEIVSDRIKEIALALAKHKTPNEKLIDYINIFLVRHKNYLNIYYYIDVLDALSSFRDCTNYEILNLFYSNLINSKNLINIPKDYLVKSLKIVSSNRLIGGFNLVEVLVKLLKDKTDEFKVKDIILILTGALKAGFNEPSFVNFYLKMISSRSMFDNLDYELVGRIRYLLDRLITEEHTNEMAGFYNYTYENITKKLNELKQLKESGYDHEMFIQFIRQELTLSKSELLDDVITEADFQQYYNTCKWISLQCLFKIRNNFEIKSIGVIQFEEGEGKVLTVDFYN